MGKGKCSCQGQEQITTQPLSIPTVRKLLFLIESSFDIVKGLYLPILYTISTLGVSIIQALPSSLIDYYSDSAYSVNEIVLPVTCNR